MKSKEILSEKDREVMRIRIEQKHAWQHPLFPASEINRILVALEAAESEIEELRKQIQKGAIIESFEAENKGN